jgi:DNA invertase Pin-like site-specific DNA recombinase
MSTPTLTSVPLGDLTELMTANRDAINAALTAHRHPSRIALYARISSDPDDTREGTDEQVTDLRRYAERHYVGVPVVAEYVDDDRSAFKASVRRDRFEDLLRDAALGVFDLVLVRDTDRLYRRLDELPRIVADLVPHAQIVARLEGEVDLTTAAGILRAQMLGAVAEHESRRKGERVADNARHRAQNGRMTASTRPFGWAWRQPCDGVPTVAGGECEHRKPHPPALRPRQGARAGLVPHPTEGPALAEAYRMVADGASLRHVARWLVAEGFTGARGAQVRAEQVGDMLKMPRHAGLVAHRGRLVADAKDGHRIVDVDLWQQVQLILGDETRRTSPGRPANTPLSGIATCGRCDGPMNASNKHSAGKRLPDGEQGPRGGKRAKGATTPVYICSRNMHLTKKRQDVDDHVLTTIGQLVIDYAPRLAQEAATDAGPAENLARREVLRLKEQIKGYQRLSAQMDPDDLVAILNKLRADVVEAEQRSAVVAARPGVVRLTAAEDVAAEWQRLVEAENREPLRRVIRELVESVVIHPRQAGSRRLPVDQAVRITWQPWVRKAAKAR